MTLKEQMLLEKSKQQILQRDIQSQENDVLDVKKSLRIAENYVKKFYLDNLNKYEVTRVPRSILELSTKNNIKLFKISQLIFNKDENIQHRLNNIYSSMHSLNLSLIFMLVSDSEKINFYMGTKIIEDDFQTNRGLAQAFEKAFNGNFPGSNISPVNYLEYDDLLKTILPETGRNAITSLTSLPALKDDENTNSQYVQGIEKLIDTMQDEKYALLIISDPLSGGQIEQVKQGYEELYTTLAPLSEYSLTLGENQGITISQSEMKGYTDTISKSISKTQSFTKGISITKSESTANTFGIGVGTMGNIGSMNSTSINNTKNKLITTCASIFGGPVATAAVTGLSQAIGANLGLNANKTKQRGTAWGDNESEQIGNQTTDQKSTAKTTQQAKQQGITTGSSTSSMVKYENKSIKVFLECIEEHLKRLKECENYGMWSSAAYFISPSKETSIIAASTYKGIINGEGTSLEVSSMNTWFKDEATQRVNTYLRHFTHPRFHDPDFLINDNVAVDVIPSTMLSTKEIAVQCSVPYKSVPGVSVREMATFGRNVYDVECSAQKVRIGSIYHMGKVYKNQEVYFDLEKLREHMFITGSTGSGKSNFVYSLIAKLNGIKVNSKITKIPTLIIEPAKGEYKQVFGDDLHVFGTNPEITPLLRINPFKFEKGIHVLEHIDRLIDIFNVCWPMYAAMPAVLKEAVEDAYIQCGWDLGTSKNRTGYEIYPCFNDLLISLKNVIKSSDYSQEVKDNYTGSLITRVKSLTNGLNQQIFVSNEIDNKKLFEESTIIDLSRVGSSETKSMIMGIILMRLQERRMAQGGINLPLKHLTILEEAHHLLKRTSTEQSTEGSNLLGKSVEMISNAIAEMRTYGEGFIIVDQAPALLDMSVIRNTNTKVIMHLPDMTDRELVGKAASLTDDQLVELAKIPSGVGAIYQNKWVEPILCKNDYFSENPKEYKLNSNEQKLVLLEHDFIRSYLAQYLVSLLINEKSKIDVKKLKQWLISSDLETSLKLEILDLMKSTKEVKKNTIERLITNMIDSKNAVFERAQNVESIEEWNEALIEYSEISKSNISPEYINHILECLIHYRSLNNPSEEEYYLKWMQHMGRKVI